MKHLRSPLALRLYEILGKYGNFSITGLPDNIATQNVRAKMLDGLNKVNNGEWDKMIQEKQFGAIDATFNWPLYVGGKIRAANKAADIRYTEAQEVHHKSYDSLYNEPLEDLISVCKDCHLKIHIINDLEKNRRQTRVKPESLKRQILDEKKKNSQKKSFRKE